MATGTTSPLLLLLLPLLLPLLSISAAARPCNTLFFITTSDQIQNPLLPQNPNPNQHRTYFITEFHRFHNPTKPYLPPFEPPIFSDQNLVFSKPQTAHHLLDKMSDVGSLLFGFGCGSLTAATMYLIWALFNPRRFDFGDSDDEFVDLDEDVANPKKMGYVAIPAAGGVTTVEFPTAATPTKEV